MVMEDLLKNKMCEWNSVWSWFAIHVLSSGSKTYLHENIWSLLKAFQIQSVLKKTFVFFKQFQTWTICLAVPVFYWFIWIFLFRCNSMLKRQYQQPCFIGKETSLSGSELSFPANYQLKFDFFGFLQFTTLVKRFVLMSVNHWREVR